MKRRKRHTRLKHALSLTTLQQLAPNILRAAGEKQPGEHFQLTKASGLWSCADGTVTARLVYRANGAAEAVTSIVYQIRNIVIE